MVLGNQIEWALHCCSVMTGLEPNETLPTKSLAEFHGVPKEYLSKALQFLAQAGLVIGTLGPKGGYRLAKPPHEITFLDIVEAVEGRRKTFECTEIRGNNPCVKDSKAKVTGVCAIAKVMYRADTAWRKELANVTLADLAHTVKRDVGAPILNASLDWLRGRG